MHDFRCKQLLLLQPIFQDFEGITSKQSIGSTSDVNNQQILTSLYFRLRYSLLISVLFKINESQFVLSITKSESALLCVSAVSNKDKQTGSKIEFHNFC